MKFRNIFSWYDEKGKCGNCGRVQPKWNDKCESCGRVFSNSDSLEANTILSVVGFVIFFPLLNLPAFLPSLAITMSLSKNVFPMFAEGFYHVITVIISLLFFCVVVWEIFKLIFHKLSTLEGLTKKIGLGIFWAYIIGCYGLVSYNMGTEFFKDSFWGIVAFTIFGTLLGGAYSGRKLGLIDEDGNEIKK